MSKASPAFLKHLRAEAKLYEKQLGQMVNQERNKQGLSQKEFGGQFGLSRTEVHFLEAGETDMKLSTFIVICHAMHRGVGAVAADLEHQVEHPEHRVPEQPLKNQRGKNTRRSAH